MTYSQLQEFHRAIVREELGGQTQRYLGHVTQAFKQGVISRQGPITNLMRTANTERACRACQNGRTVVVKHINGDLTERKCNICGGTGRVRN